MRKQWRLGRINKCDLSVLICAPSREGIFFARIKTCAVCVCIKAVGVDDFIDPRTTHKLTLITDLKDNRAAWLDYKMQR